MRLYDALPEHLYPGMQTPQTRLDIIETGGLGGFSNTCAIFQIFEVIIERKHKTALINTIIPLLLIGWLGVFGTLIPYDSGEKLRYSYGPYFMVQTVRSILYGPYCMSNVLENNMTNLIYLKLLGHRDTGLSFPYNGN